MEGLAHAINIPLLELAGGNLTVASLATGVLVFVLARMLARAAGVATGRVLGTRGVPEGTRFAIAKVVRYALVTLGALVAVGAMGFRLDALLTASAALLVGVGLGLQNTFQNVFAGLVLLLEQPIRRGDFIQVGDAYGVVNDIGLRATHVLTRDLVKIVVPNAELVSSRVVNHSQPTTDLRIKIEVGVAYGSDTDLVRRTLLAVATGEARVLGNPAPEVRLDAFGDSSLDFSLLVWIADPAEDLRIASSLRFAIDAAFRREGISIPFPQRDLHVKSDPAVLSDSSRAA